MSDLIDGANCSTLVDLLLGRAAQSPERRSHLFLIDGEVAGPELTYGELDRRARAIAATLQLVGSRGERAILVYEPGLEFVSAFFGCLYAGLVAVPAPAPAKPLTRALQRLSSILPDATPCALLTTASLLPAVNELRAAMPELAALHVIATDTIPVDTAVQWQQLEQSGDSLAVFQYTSGSTSSPRGVMVAHRHLLHNAAFVRKGWGYTPDTIALTWMPVFHDLGLMDSVILPVFTGYLSIVMSYVAFLQRPMRWLEAISRYGVTYSAAPNFAFDLCVRKSTPEAVARLDLHRWDSVLNAAEPIRKGTLDRFVQTFEPAGFRASSLYPGYGTAEATLKLTSFPKGTPMVFCTVRADELEQNRVVEVSSGEGGRTITGCGLAENAEFGIKVEIVHPERLTRTAPGEVGEIWAQSPSVAYGYWNRPEESEQTFHAHLADTGEGPFLRTGDLGFVKQGVLFVTGRLKDLVIVHGRNHYPQDIELTVESSHPCIRPGCSAAFSIEMDNEEVLVVCAEVDRRVPMDVKPTVSGIRRAILEYHELATHDVVLLAAGSVPKTTSGKIRRRTCRAAYLAGALDRFEP